MGMSAFYGPTKTQEENFKVLTRAADIGVTFWDTADVYGNGHNEGSAIYSCLIFRNDWQVVQEDWTQKGHLLGYQVRQHS
jgi:hypothetical protein